MKKSRGSITFFMSIVYLSLVTFALGLTEAYRLQYLYAKQETLGRVALHNLKADYIADIMEEYGLLFYHEALAGSKLTLERTAKTLWHQETASLYFQDLLSGQNWREYYHFPFFEAKETSLKKTKVEMDYQQLMAARAEAILYARDKLPFTALEPWLEKLKVWQKSSKAEEWLTKKDKILKSFKESDRQLKKLYRYLDGAEIDAKTQAAQISGSGVNFFNVNSEMQAQKEAEINGRSDLPERLKTEMLDRQTNAEDLRREIESWADDSRGIIDDYLPVDPELNPVEQGIRQMELNNDLAKRKLELTELLQPDDDLADAYRNAERMAAEIADNYESQVPAMKAFLQELEQADLSGTVKNSLRHEIEQLLWQCDPANSVSRIGNFKYLQEKLAAEKEAFLAILKDLKSFYAKGQSLLTAYQSAKSANREWDDTAWEDWKAAGEILLTGRVDAYFYFPLSYQNYRETENSEDADSLEQKQQAIGQTAENQLAEALFLDQEKILNTSRLPSELAVAVKTRDIVITQGLLQQAEQAFRELSEKFIVNEYYFMVFSHFALQPADELAISGYAKSDHARRGELEYLLFGGAETTNQAAMIAVLFGVRLLFNVIALISDPVKMATVNSLAAAIAGWWSLGAGTLIVTGVIVGLWAALETGADIFMLFRGKRVPLVKTAATWYTSLQGALSGVALEAVEALAETAEKVLKKGTEVFQDNLNALAGSLTGDLRYYLENRTAEQAEELSAEIQALDRSIRQSVESAVRQKLQGYAAGKEKAERELTEMGLSPVQAKAIIEKAFQPIEQAGQEIEENYTKKVEAAEKAIAEAEAEIEKVLRETENKGKTAIKEKLSELGTEFNKLGKDTIKQQKELLKQKIDQKLKPVRPKAEGQSGAKDWRDYIGMNYVDYLRLFLLADFVPADVKWLRALDLIQQNQQQTVPDFYLLDCERRFELHSAASYRPVFLPFGEKGRFGTWLEDKYRVEVRTEGGY